MQNNDAFDWFMILLFVILLAALVGYGVAILTSLFTDHVHGLFP